MSRINFNACHTIGDIERLHSDVLPGKLLIEQDTSDIYNVREVKMPIFGIRRNNASVIFETERTIGEREFNVFHMGAIVVTSVYESGDVFWPIHDNPMDTVYYTIDDLNEKDFDFDGLLRTANELAGSIEWPEPTRLTV